MSRATTEVADIVRSNMAGFLEQSRSWLSFQQLKVLQSIARCRTAALGGHIDSCSACGHRTISYNSCRDRHCPKCQAQARERWLAARDSELLGVPYFHVVFTLPHELNALCQYNPKLLYDLLVQTSAATLLEVAADPKHLGAEIGFLSILHTWGQNLSLHPHLHCAIPAGGLSPDHTRWVHPRYTFFLPVKVLSRVFRGKFIAGLRRRVSAGGWFPRDLVIQELRSAVSANVTSVRVGVDFSSLTRIRIALIFEALRQIAADMKVVVSVDWYYAIARFSKAPIGFVPNLVAEPVSPAFAGWVTEPERDTVAIVGLGYEQDKALGAVELVQPSQTWALRPVSIDPRHDRGHSSQRSLP